MATRPRPSYGAIISPNLTKWVRHSLSSPWTWAITCSCVLVRDFSLKIRWIPLPESINQAKSINWQITSQRSLSFLSMMISPRLFLNFKIFFTFCNLNRQTLNSQTSLSHLPQTLSMSWRETEPARQPERLMRDFFCPQFVTRLTIFMLRVSLKPFGPSQMRRSLMIRHYGASSASSPRRKTLPQFLSPMKDGQQRSFPLTPEVNISSRASSPTSQTPYSTRIKSISSKFTMASWRLTPLTAHWDLTLPSSILRLSTGTNFSAEMISSRRLSTHTLRQLMHSNRKISRAVDINTSEKELRRAAAEVTHTLLIIQSI